MKPRVAVAGAGERDERPFEVGREAFLVSRLALGVGDAVGGAFLVGGAASGMTGDVIYVDSGVYNLPTNVRITASAPCVVPE